VSSRISPFEKTLPVIPPLFPLGGRFSPFILRGIHGHVARASIQNLAILSLQTHILALSIWRKNHFRRGIRMEGQSAFKSLKAITPQKYLLLYDRQAERHSTTSGPRMPQKIVTMCFSVSIVRETQSSTSSFSNCHVGPGEYLKAARLVSCNSSIEAGCS
jgi:hypothetical protein